MKINEELLEQIIKAIRFEPLRLEMDEYLDVADSKAPCGTAGCIAGHAVVIDIINRSPTRNWSEVANSVLQRHEAHTLDIETKAQRLLKLSDKETTRLFYVWAWPESFVNEMFNNKDRRSKAKITVRRIRHFIKTEGAE